MMNPLNDLLERHGQQHLLRFWDELSPAQQAELEADVRGVDFEQIDALYRAGEAAHDWAALARRAEPPKAFRLDGTGNQFSPAEAMRRGEDAMPQVAAVLVAGGQGSRLGFHHPKGMFPIGPVSGHTLFQILFEKTLAAGRPYGVRIPLYVMTSPATHDETAAFLAEHKNFGVAEEDLTLFCQGTMPAVDVDTGRLLLAGKHGLALSPDGTGGVPAAMQRAGVLENMQRRGIRQVCYMQVDNPLVSVCDPEFLGYHLLAGSELSTQVVTKPSPTDSLGNVVSIDGQVHILEYSDLNRVGRDEPDILTRRTADGGPVFWAGNLGVHVFDVEFLQRVMGEEGSLPFHVAKKKVPCVDIETGKPITPQQPNAIKFERFIFDLLPLAREAIVVEVDRQTQFAPLKNGPGAKTDTPEAVRSQMTRLHRRWLLEAGVQVEKDVKVEINPLFARKPEQLAGRMKPGSRIDKDQYLVEPD